MRRSFCGFLSQLISFLIPGLGGSIIIIMGLEDFDLVIRNARIVDGTGALWYRGDVGVIGGNIAFIGQLPSEFNSSEIVLANGSYLSPGFIDSHTHDDVAILENPVHPAKVWQGVTTIITGNCGFSNYPEGQLPSIQEHLRSLLGSIDESLFFHNFTEYKDRLSQQGIGVNVGSLVGQGPLRLAVVGNENRKATDEEIEVMCNLLEAQLSEGALGLSLGLVYAPSSYASRKELVSLARIVKKYDATLSAHIRSYEGTLLQSIEEFLDVLQQSGARGLLSHLQAAGRPYWGNMIPKALAMIKKARDVQGIDIGFDMYPYTAGSSTILQLLPPSALAGGFEVLERNIRENKTFLRDLKEKVESGREEGWESKVALIGYENIVIGSVVNEELRFYEGKSISEASGIKEEFQLLILIILQDLGRTNIIMFQQSEDDNNLVISSPLGTVGSDSIPRAGGKPHPRGFGTFPKVVGRRGEGTNLSIEEVIRKCTSATASRFGIRDRGLILPGMKADLLLFSEEIKDQATYEEPTLKPKGIQGVWVNGVRVVNENGEVINETDNFPGQVILKRMNKIY